MFDFSFCSEHISKSDDPDSMLKGMKGYQLTPGDLEFIEKMKQEKLIKELQVIFGFLTDRSLNLKMFLSAVTVGFFC